MFWFGKKNKLKDEEKDITENDVEIDDMKFTATHRGEYVVYYYAQDTSGNVAKTHYKIIVE